MSISCPSCAATMTVTPFVTHLGTPVEIDVCWPCHLIWFDHLESASLSPQSVIDLFRRIHSHRSDSRNIVSLTGKCPACRDTLINTNDVTRSGRFSYYRCPQGHGRLISFLQFLREKNFVRTLTAPELAALSAKVKQIRCSSCGAGVDIEHDSSCTHCGAPVSVLDENAVAKALTDLDAKVRHLPTPLDNSSSVSYQPKQSVPVDNGLPSMDISTGSELTDLLLTGLAAIIAASLD